LVSEAGRRFSTSSLDSPLNDESPAMRGAFSEAAEGTRTLDLLHGKQTL
jgi:hypothetical protein